jgi:hypothetical protein
VVGDTLNIYDVLGVRPGKKDGCTENKDKRDRDRLRSENDLHFKKKMLWSF